MSSLIINIITDRFLTYQKRYLKYLIQGFSWFSFHINRISVGYSKVDPIIVLCEFITVMKKESSSQNKEGLSNHEVSRSEPVLDFMIR